MEVDVTYQDFDVVNGGKFNIASLNIHSLRNKRDQLELEVKRLGDIHLIVVTETWVQEGFEGIYEIDGFRAYHVLRNDGYGGMAMYVRDDVGHVCLKRESRGEVHVIVIKILSCNCRVIGVYRPPRNTNLRDFEAVIDGNCETTDDCLLVGDTNINLLGSGDTVESYVSLLQSNSLTILNKVLPQFFTFPIAASRPGAPGSMIDHFATNFSNKRFSISRHDVGFSDHILQILSVHDQDPIDDVRPCYRVNWNAVRSSLANFLDTNELTSMTFQSLHEFLSRSVLSNRRIFYPMNANQNAAWITPQIVAEMRHRDFLNAEWKDPSLDLMEVSRRKALYARQRNRVTAMVRHSKINVVDGMTRAACGNQGRIWDVIRYVLTNKSKVSRPSLPFQLIDSLGHILDTPEQIANCFTDFFARVSDDLRNDLITTNCFTPRNLTITSEIDRSMRLRKTNADEVSQALRSLKSDSAMGLDYVSTRFLRQNAESLTLPLVQCINDAFETGEYPECFKEARLSCIFKAGDPRLPTNYRPLSVSKTLARVFEKPLYSRLLEYFLSIDFFHPHQYGFLPNSNTECASITAVGRLIGAIERSEVSIVVTIDVSKAFDCVDHDILLQKLYISGIRGPVFDLLQSYLFGRSHRFDDGCVSSHQVFLGSGVPQGASVSNLLFLAYMNDFLDLPLRGHAQLYADDALLIYSGTDIQALVDLVNEDLELVYKWFYNNLLSFNPSKTKFMVVTPKGKKIDVVPPVVVRGNLIERVSSCKYLGLIMNEHLLWDDHLRLIKKKLYPILAMLRKTAFMLPEETKLSVYYSHFHTHLTYMASIWGSAPQNRIQEIARLQNKAIRYTFWKDYRLNSLSTNEIYVKYHIPKLTSLIEMSFINTVYKIRNSMIRVEIDLPTTSEHHERNTRRGSRLVVPTSRTNYHRHSFWHQGVNLFNELPSNIRGQPNFPSFKRLLKSHVCSTSHEN